MGFFTAGLASGVVNTVNNQYADQKKQQDALTAITLQNVLKNADSYNSSKQAYTKMQQTAAAAAANYGGPAGIYMNALQSGTKPEDLASIGMNISKNAPSPGGMGTQMAGAGLVPTQMGNPNDPSTMNMQPAGRASGSPQATAGTSSSPTPNAAPVASPGGTNTPQSPNLQQPVQQNDTGQPTPGIKQTLPDMLLGTDPNANINSNANRMAGQVLGMNQDQLNQAKTGVFTPPTADTQGYHIDMTNARLAAFTKEFPLENFRSASDYSKAMELAKTGNFSAAGALQDPNAASSRKINEGAAEADNYVKKFAAMYNIKNGPGGLLDTVNADPRTTDDEKAYLSNYAKLTPTEKTKVQGAVSMVSPNMSFGQALKLASGNANTDNVLSDESANRMAQQYLAGDRQAIAGLGIGAAGNLNRVKVQNAVTAQAKDLNMSPEQTAAKLAEFSGLTSGERALGTRTANIGIASNEFLQMAPLGITASNNVNRTQYPNLNAIDLAVQKGTGDENTVRLAAATNSLVNIYARAINPSGVATDADKAHGRAILDKAFSQGQYAAAVNQMQLEINAALKAPGAVKQQMRSDFIEQPQQSGQTQPPAEYPNAKQSPQDGQWYIPDPARPGKYLHVGQ